MLGPTDFYPVYTDYVSNIMTVFEGNEQDATDDQTRRDGVGKTDVKVETAEDGTSAYTVQVLDVSGKAISEEGQLPDGYRFLGWYENKGTEDAPLEVRVSRDPSYTLPADVDLTAPHTYIARFEYRVDYYVRAYTNHEFTDSKLLCSVWNRYQTPFEENVGSTFVRENVVHWGPEHVDHGIKDSYETCDTRFTKETLVVSPLNAYSHNVKNDTGADTLKNLYADTDFPGAATLSDTWTSASLNVTVKPVNDRYRLNFWTLERDGEYWTYVKNPIESMVRTDKKYYVRAMITTDVNFYNKGDNVVRTATRRYESNLLQTKVNGADPTFTYYYPHVNKSVKVAEKPEDGEKGSYESPLTLEASPTDADMAVPGYKFLGWISTAEVQKDSDVWKYIYDVAGDSYVTSDPDKAEPYLATDESKVTQWQDAYPVYAKYDVSYTTNLHRAGFEGTDKVNVPSYNIAPVINADTNPATATVTLTLRRRFIKQAVSCISCRRLRSSFRTARSRRFPTMWSMVLALIRWNLAEPIHSWRTIRRWRLCTTSMPRMWTAKLLSKTICSATLMAASRSLLMTSALSMRIQASSTSSWAGRKPSRHLARAMSLGQRASVW